MYKGILEMARSSIPPLEVVKKKLMHERWDPRQRKRGDAPARDMLTRLSGGE